jgi:hypothetical protein
MKREGVSCDSQGLGRAAPFLRLNEPKKSSACCAWAHNAAKSHYKKEKPNLL